MMESHRRVRQLNSLALRIRRAVLAPELQLAVDAFARGADGHPEFLLRLTHPGVEIGGHRAEPAPEADLQRLRHGLLRPRAAGPIGQFAAAADRKCRSR